MGGTYGDLVSGLINENIKVDDIKKVVVPSADSSRLKKPHLFSNDHQKNQYLEEVAQKFNSISSHDAEYHIRNNHEFLAIVVDDYASALRCAYRFKLSHRDEVWNEMMTKCGASTVEDYANAILNFSHMIKKHAKWSVSTTEIENGEILLRIQEIQNKPIQSSVYEMYKHWQETVNYVNG
jgi:hypothetical protein